MKFLELEQSQDRVMLPLLHVPGQWLGIPKYRDLNLGLFSLVRI